MLFNNVKYQEQRVISEGPLRAIVEVVDKGWVPAPGLQPVNSVRQVELGERISVLLSDGKLSATVMDKKEEAR